MGDISKIRTGNKDLKDTVENGCFNFYVRSRNIQKIDSFAYDGEAILLGGDGKIDDLLHYYNGKFNFHQRVYLITSELFNMKYLFYAMEFGIGRHVMRSSAKTTVDSVRLPFLKDFKVCSIPKKKQVQIGELLSSIDNLIELNYIKIKEVV